MPPSDASKLKIFVAVNALMLDVEDDEGGERLKVQG
jgi:hypothetical protein